MINTLVFEGTKGALEYGSVEQYFLHINNARKLRDGGVVQRLSNF